MINGAEADLTEVLVDVDVAFLVSHEGPLPL
jgi:hypothetical protein